MKVRNVEIFIFLNVGILIFSIIANSIGQNVRENKYFGSYIVGVSSWDIYDCGRYNSLIDNSLNKIQKNIFKMERSKCRRHKAMIGLEYSIISLNFIFSIISIFLGIFLKAGEDSDHTTAKIGLFYPIIGFILSVIYIGYSGYILNNDSPTFIDYNNIYEISNISPINSVFPKNGIIKINEEGAFAKLNKETNKYELLYPPKDQEDIYGSFAKYKDLEKKQYNFNKYLYIKKNYDPYFQYCEYNDPLSIYAGLVSKKVFTDINGNSVDCNFLYSHQIQEDNYNSKFYNTWVTTLFCCSFILLLYVGIILSIKIRIDN